MFRLDDSTSRNRGFVNEGNVPVYLFSREPTLVQFIVDRFQEELYKKQGKTDEEIQTIFTAEAQIDWINPVGLWEHTVRNGGKFSTAFCIGGRDGCKYCEPNSEAKDSGVTENRMLPYPMRRRHVLPAWFYDQQKLLYVKQASDFFDELATYLEEHKKGTKYIPLDFKIFKQGEKLDTRYKLMFIGPSKEKIKPKDLMKPNKLDFIPVEQKDFREFAEGDEDKESLVNKDLPGDKTPAKDFMIDFGSYAGQSLQEIWDSGDKEFIVFLRDKSTGVVQEKAKAFMKGKKA